MLKLTAILEYFVPSVYYIRVVLQTPAYKCMDVQLYMLLDYQNRFWGPFI